MILKIYLLQDRLEACMCVFFSMEILLAGAVKGLNAALKSSSASRTKFPLFALQRISFSTQKTAVSVLCPGRYAD